MIQLGYPLNFELNLETSKIYESKSQTYKTGNQEKCIPRFEYINNIQKIYTNILY